MRFTNFKTIKLATAPGSGDNPPAGSVYEWQTLDGSNNLVINYRLADGTDKTFAVGGGSGGSMTVTEVNTNTTIENNKLYVANSSNVIVFTLPAMVAAGFRFAIQNKGTGGFWISAGASGQVFRRPGGSSNTATVAGQALLRNYTQYDYAEFVTVTMNTDFQIVLNGSSIIFTGGSGYSAGGFITVGINNINALLFSTEANSSIAATLSAVRYNGSGFNSESKGFSVAGIGGQSAIDALVFANEANGVIAATLSSARIYCAGINSTLKGYSLGGTSSGIVNTIDALVFATEANAAITAVLPTARNGGMGFNSSGKGYFAGGEETPNIGKISALTFGAEACSDIAATLNVARRLGAAFNSASKGYIAGGYASTLSSEIDSLVFATDAKAAVAATLSSVRYGAVGYNSTIKGYSAGGNTGSNASVIEGLAFASEATAVLSAVLSSARYAAAGFQSGGAL
ncbi:MAG: hypothetical protein ACYC4Q_07295 [Victivallaceae bacterium]